MLSRTISPCTSAINLATASWSTGCHAELEVRRLYGLWDGNRFRRWAEKIGPAIKRVIEAHLHAYEVEEQAYKSCIAMLKLAKTYTDKRLENACKLALQKDPAPSYSYLKNILAQGLDIEVEPASKPRKAHAFLRGAAYYGGGCHEE